MSRPMILLLTILMILNSPLQIKTSDNLANHAYVQLILLEILALRSEIDSSSCCSLTKFQHASLDANDELIYTTDCYLPTCCYKSMLCIAKNTCHELYRGHIMKKAESRFIERQSALPAHEFYNRYPYFRNELFIIGHPISTSSTFQQAQCRIIPINETINEEKIEKE